MESHLNLAVCSLETTLNQVKDQSKQIERLTSIFNDKSQQLNDQSQQIDSLTSTIQGLVQQVESLTGQAVLVEKTTNQTNDCYLRMKAVSVVLRRHRNWKFYRRKNLFYQKCADI